MIIDAFVTWVLAMVQTVVELFPEWELIPADDDSMWHALGPALGTLNMWFPVPTIFQCLLIWIAAEGTYVTVLLIRWTLGLIKGWL